MGEFRGPPPYYGNPKVFADIYDLHTAELKEARARLQGPGTYKTWRRIPPPPRSGELDSEAETVPRRHPGHPAAVAITITDQGPGMDEATRRTLFEPFFTTKPGGTGLGLYITHEIVKRHGGSLTVLSEPGQGATFRVELPLDPEGERS